MSSSDLPLAWNDFGLRLLRHWTQTEPAQNRIVSPLSITAALLMAWSGARQQTAAELSAALGLGTTDAETALRACAITSDDPHVTLHSANGLWSAQELSADFVSLCQRTLAAELAQLGDPQDTAQRINAWVSAQTRGKISDLLQPADLIGAVLALVNALYFKGQWQHPFDPQRTTLANFHRLDGEARPLPFMQQKKLLPVLQTERFQAVRLPYGNGRFCMELFLPQQGSPADLLMQPDELNKPTFTPHNVRVRLPRFALESRLDLIPALQANGIRSAFESGADFSGMGLHGLFISHAVHKARLEVDEQGSEAAAATAMVMKRGALPSKVLELTFDRPFACQLRDTHSDLILFQALIFDPSE